MTTAPTKPPHRSRHGPISALAAAAMTLLVKLPASPASTHHGWDGFEPEQLVYLMGTVSTEGTWVEPPSFFGATLDRTLPADTPELEIPEHLQDAEDSSRVTAALSYSDPHEELEAIIAPPALSGKWSLSRALEVGERFQGAGYVNRDMTLWRSSSIRTSSHGPPKASTRRRSLRCSARGPPPTRR